jgi:hypothetical protein
MGTKRMRADKGDKADLLGRLVEQEREYKVKT